MTCLTTGVEWCVCVLQDPDLKFLIQTKAAGWKATDWNLDKPDWKGKLRLVWEVAKKSYFFSMAMSLRPHPSHGLKIFLFEK